MRKSKINKMPSDDIFYGEKYRIQSEEYGDCYIYIYIYIRWLGMFFLISSYLRTDANVQYRSQSCG